MTEITLTNIHLRLRQVRRERQISQEELARRLGISRQAVIALEQGVSLPSLPVILALIKVLDLPFDNLFGDSWTPFRPFSRHAADTSTRLAAYRHPLAGDQIPICLIEDDSCFTIAAELPGVTEDDITIDTSQQHVMIMAVKKPSDLSEIACPHVEEITYGPVMRIISLPFPVDTAGARAELSRGVLTLKLPKLMPQTHRRVPIEPVSDAETR